VAVATLFLVACNQEGPIRQQALSDSRAVSFTSQDGVRLAGRVFGPQHPQSGVVLAHMFPADQSSWFEFADRLAGLGYAALTFDFRGYCPGGSAGCSQGSKDISAIWQDVEGAARFLEQSTGLGSVTLVGASMGGTAALIVAARSPQDVSTVVTLSAPEEFSGLVAGPEVLANVTASKLFIAGNGDGIAAQTAQTFFDESPQPKDLQIVTSSDHGTALLEGNQAEIVRNLIVGFLGQHAPAQV
jgi:pimeloyl-ACP methyl ester carboxylesterase